MRTALQAMAAVLGGAQSLHTNSLDEAWALPGEHAVTLALRTQQVIAYESGVTAEPDPFGGSYFLERLTLETEAGGATITSAQIDGMGGMIAAIEQRLSAGRNRARQLRISARGGSRASRHRGRESFPVGEDEPDRNPADRRTSAEAPSAENCAGCARSAIMPSVRSERSDALRSAAEGTDDESDAAACSTPCALTPRWERSATLCARCSGRREDGRASE